MTHFPLPKSVAVAQLSDYSEATSCATETALVRRATVARQWEFAAGRTCARRALRQLGARPQPILAGRWGEPIWPSGIVGSISHSRGFCACAVGRSQAFHGIGIDVEDHTPLKPGVIESITRCEERARLTGLEGAVPEVNWDVILFSAKETAFKALFPTRPEPMEYSDFSVFIDVKRASFEARCMQGVDGVMVRGRWRIQGDFVLTAVALPVSKKHETEGGDSQVSSLGNWRYG
jgi:4'-phosphopantetheinyl transferase EntD